MRFALFAAAFGLLVAGMYLAQLVGNSYAQAHSFAASRLANVE